jgi:hypothetical protein
MRRRVGLKSVVHNPLATAMKKLGMEPANTKLKPITVDRDGKGVKHVRKQ